VIIKKSYKNLIKNLGQTYAKLMKNDITGLLQNVKFTASDVIR